MYNGDKPTTGHLFNVQNETFSFTIEERTIIFVS